MIIEISVAKDFSDTPGARYVEDGPWSGQEFREKFLKMNFTKPERPTLLIDLDNTEGYATSFLEEAFGGLAREFGKDEVLKRLKFRSDQDPLLIEEIISYIKDAK